MSDVFIFSNPIAGRGRGRDIAERIARASRHEGLAVRVFLGPAETIADDEFRNASPPQAVVAVGGDGTIRAVVERLVQLSDGNVSAVPPVLVVPLGTANLLARHLQIDWDQGKLERQIVDCVLRRKLRTIDAASANGRLFLLMTGVGIDAAIVHELDRMRRGPIDLSSYALPALLAIQSYDYPPLRVEVDGQCIANDRPAMAFVGNVPEYGTGFPILSLARSDDGLLDVCVLPCKNRLQVVKLLMASATGDHLHEEGVVYATGRSIRIDSRRPVPVQIDGEASGHTPLKVELLPFRLPFIVP